MLKSLLLFCLLIVSSLHAYCIVFVHLGHSSPSYLPIALAQARLFNRECPIYLLANQDTLTSLSSTLLTNQVSLIPCESLQRSDWHECFNRQSTHDRKNMNGFWFYTSERFFYLEEFIRQYNLTDVFHLENDVMIYVDLNQLLPIFKQHYANCIGATFEDDGRCVPGFVYIPHARPLEPLLKLMAQRASSAEQEMFVIGLFDRDYHGVFIDSLPVIPPQYWKEHELRVLSRKARNPAEYSNHFDAFDSIFDAAAIGQFLGGMNPQYHGDAGPGYVSTITMYKISHFTFEWQKDKEGRYVPYYTYAGEKRRINNLHIHCKNLKSFYSLRGETK